MAKNRVEYKEKITKALDELPLSRLSVALDFVEYLRDRQGWKETQEILGNKELMSQLEEADRDWKAGDYDEGDYVEWQRQGV